MTFFLRGWEERTPSVSDKEPSTKWTRGTLSLGQSAVRILRTVPERHAEPRLDNLNSTELPSFVALPGAKVRFPARLVCQGRALRSRERKQKAHRLGSLEDYPSEYQIKPLLA